MSGDIQSPTTANEAQTLALMLFENAHQIMKAVITGSPVTYDSDSGFVDPANAVEYARHLRETAAGYLQWAQLTVELNAYRDGAFDRGWAAGKQ